MRTGIWTASIFDKLSNRLCERSKSGKRCRYQIVFAISTVLVNALMRVSPPASGCSLAISVAGAVPIERPEEDDVSTGHFAYYGEIGKRGPGMFIDSLLLWGALAARPVSAVIDHKEISSRPVQREQFSCGCLLQDLTVAVKYH
jgi:hypothetical protein